MDPIFLALQQRAAKAAPRPTARAVPRPGAPAPPNFQDLLAQLAAGPARRSEEEWNSLLEPRLKPYTDAINQSTNMARGMNEYRFEQSQAGVQGLSEAFLRVLTGGKTGDEAMAFTKENFGGSYLGGQAMSMAADALRNLTNDFDDRDWEITGQYLQAMNEIPAIRDELRAKVEASDKDDYATRVQTASLLLDETWRYYNANRENFEKDRDFNEDKRRWKKQFGLAEEEQRVRLGLDAMGEETDRINANTSAKNADLRAAELDLKRAREQRQKAKDKASIRQADERIRIAKDKVALQRRKASGKGSDAQKAETNLALDILNDREEIIGKKSASGVSSGGMSYEEAYNYLRGQAEALMGSYRSSAYIDNWTRQRLKALGYTGPQKRSGR